MTEEATPGTNSAADRSVRFLLESDNGLLINLTEELGEHLLLWSSREAAERMCTAFAGIGHYWVSEIESTELRDELEMMRDEGMRFVMIDPQPDAAGQKLTIEEAIVFYSKLSEPLREARSEGDHFIQRLERLRRKGAVDRDAELMPVDCPVCKGYFTVSEAVYRRWRDGLTEFLRCPKCLATVREVEFARVKCADCKAESGWMPLSLSRGIGRGEIPWRCLDCGEVAVKELAAEQKKRKRRFLGVDDWYPIIMGTIAFIALLAGAYVKFVLMAD